jgi:tetratricopeptide (TPR) repeat protein
MFPAYMPRVEEEKYVRAEAAKVQQEKTSRVLLLYGPGGIGKTSLVRALAADDQPGQHLRWLDPIDIDDPEYWLLSTLERKVARQLDPQNEYFGEYFQYVSRLPSYTRQRIAHETVVSHLGRIKRVFVDCYTQFVRETDTTVVLFFDTVETIRGVYLVYTLTQWMKALPGTLFVLSGRPPAQGSEDPIEVELRDPHQQLPVTTLRLGEFTQQAALDYLALSPIADGLSDDEREKLVLLARGHPLWLAFAISYITEKGVPAEVTDTSVEEVRRLVPYQGGMGTEGQRLHEEFKRRLVTPYREVDFWHDAVKRLAVVRQSVSKPVWERLMNDRQLPRDSETVDEAWETLLAIPWIRTRLNRQQVNLHDAVAEELAHKIIPLHDRDQTWRRDLWTKAAHIYRDLTEAPEAEVTRELDELDEALGHLDARKLQLTREGRAPTAQEEAEESEFIQEVARLDARKRAIDQFRAVGFYYQLLYDFPGGSARFLELFDEARRERDVFLQDRLALEMQRFLPSDTRPEGVDDVIRGVITEFHRWLASDGSDWFIQVGTSVAGYLVENEKPGAALALLDRLPRGDDGTSFRMSILKGNALLRMPGRTADGLTHFLEGRRLAEILRTPDRHRRLAEAHKELGFYYRNQGLWPEADSAYETARDSLLASGAATFPDEDREEMASIQTNWAYVKGLRGQYLDGANLVESAINVRHRLAKPQGEGISWSVRGELYRFERHFEKAWESYAEAEQIFNGLRDWPWLGIIYQEQASCLFQASRESAHVSIGRDPMDQAKRLILRALDICHDQNLRGYPSALNRAGRIFGAEDVDAGLRYLSEGIEQARRLSDGWFLLANLIEYVDLCYHNWEKTRRPHYRDGIEARRPDIEQAVEDYAFPDLEGRWQFILGGLAVHQGLETDDPQQFGDALEHFTRSFALMARGNIGSSGAYAVPEHFQELHSLLLLLPPTVRTQWLAHLHSAWSRLDEGSTLLLARLQELY